MSKACKSNREYLTAISIINGIIVLILPDGEIGYFRQRGIQRLPNEVIANLIATNRLDRRWKAYKELPSNYSISFEDEEIMGKARATFPYKG